MRAKKSVKRMPKRIKKAIRRALSGVCMVSAIIVALVPAKPTQGYTIIPVASGEGAVQDYSYGVDQTDAHTDDIAVGAGMVLDAHLPDTLTDTTPGVYKTYYVRRTGQDYEYGWQFKFYNAVYNGASQGVICSYNSSYETDELEISKYLPVEYLTITLDEYKNFFDPFYDAMNNGTTANVTIDGYSYPVLYRINSLQANIVDGTDEYFLKKYFPADYASYLISYHEYESKHADYLAYQQWASGPMDTEAPNNQTVDATIPVLEKYVAAMQTSDLAEYFCYVNRKYNNATITIKGYKLVLAYDTASTSVSGSDGIRRPQIYLVQGEPNTLFDSTEEATGNSAHNDSLGFYVMSKTSVVAIGEKAFARVQKVNRMKLSGDIAFIGDEAFYNSYVKGITFANVGAIGNRAFKDCSQLAQIEFVAGTTTIGTEAFYGCSMLSSVKLPYSVKKIGPGAFANCTTLKDADLSEIGQTNSEIDAFAFFNDVALNSVKFSNSISKIGDGAFACTQGAYGSLTTFEFPLNLVDFGDFILAGRGNLTKVIMPANYGRTSSPAATLPVHTLWNCYNLGVLEFPDDGQGSCGFIDFSDKTTYGPIFSTITNPDFYVSGPEFNSVNTTAYPRKSTWGKLNGLGQNVPYVYVDRNGETQFEVSDGKYILGVDPEGVLISCELLDPDAVDIEMKIPEKVGNTKVTGVSSDCFNKEQLKEEMISLEIADNTISEIANGAFKDFKKLKTVHFGNTVTKIGDSAFEGCNKLTYVSFSSPKNGYSSFPVENIGENAFTTGADRLTFQGDIDEAYGPFVWATDVDNYVDEESGVRVCYKSGEPYYLTVIVDNRNGYATLVDYPHYEQLNKLSGTEGDKVAVSDSDPTQSKDYDISLTSRYEALQRGDSEVIDSVTGMPLYTYSLSLREEKMIDACINITIPSGIESIDVNGYLNNTSKLGEGYSSTATNYQNASLYCYGFDDYATYRTKGLFNGFYGDPVAASGDAKREYAALESGANDPREKEFVGNDRVKSITMNSVKYLPDNAFYSCEQLNNIVLGNQLEDLGNAPFAGCNQLTSVGSSSNNFVCYNGILYGYNEDGTYTILEVLSSRGTYVGSKKIKISDEDPYLSSVSSIAAGAFENCDGITGVDFTGMDLLTSIPDRCFKSCDQLNQVILPRNITAVGHDAFAACMEGIEVVFYGNEVFLPFDAFGKPSSEDYTRSKRVISYKDSAVRKAAQDLGADVSEVLDDTVRVQFMDFDASELSPVLYIVIGSSIPLEKIPADPIRRGYKFTGWNKPLTNMMEDTFIFATYEKDSSSNPSENPSENPSDNPSDKPSDNPSDKPSDNPSDNPSDKPSDNNNNNSDSDKKEPTKFYTLTVTNGNGSGSYAEGAVVIITCTNPPAGKVFDKWVPGSNDLGIASVNVAATTLVMPAHEATVEATFKTAPTNNSSTGNGSGNSKPNNNNSNNANKPGNTIVISKSGISNTSLASASVTGSNDNFVIRITENAAATAAVEKALTNEYGSLDGIRYTAMDITLYDSTGTNRITDYSGLSVTLTIPIPDVMTQYAGNNKVAGVVNEKLDKLTPKFTTIDGVPCITFTATHFSPYTIYVDTGNMTPAGTSDTSPKTGDGIQPKWFLVAGLMALSIALFFMKDRKTVSVRQIA